MAYGGGGAAAAAAAHAALVQAIKASGVLVRIEPEEFMKIMNNNRNGLVVSSVGRAFNRGYHYLTSYKGLAFYTKATAELSFHSSVEVIVSKQIWMPT